MHQVSCLTSASVACFPRWETAQGRSGTSVQTNAIWHVLFHAFDLVCVNLKIHFLLLCIAHFYTTVRKLLGCRLMFTHVVQSDNLYLGRWWCHSREVPAWLAGGYLRHIHSGPTQPSLCGPSF